MRSHFVTGGDYSESIQIDMKQILFGLRWNLLVADIPEKSGTSIKKYLSSRFLNSQARKPEEKPQLKTLIR